MIHLPCNLDVSDLGLNCLDLMMTSGYRDVQQHVLFGNIRKKESLKLNNSMMQAAPFCYVKQCELVFFLPRLQVRTNRCVIAR